MAEKKSYKVASPISHDGELYKVGDAIELTDSEADALGSALEGEGTPLPLGKRPAVNNPPGVEAAASVPAKAPEVEDPEKKTQAKK